MTNANDISNISKFLKTESTYLKILFPKDRKDVTIPKDTILYKGVNANFNSFDANRMSWYGDKDIAEIYKNYYTGGKLIAFKVIKDLHLINLLHPVNIKSLVDSCTNEIDKTMLRLATGYNISEEQQLEEIEKIETAGGRRDKFENWSKQVQPIRCRTLREKITLNQIQSDPPFHTDAEPFNRVSIMAIDRVILTLLATLKITKYDYDYDGYYVHLSTFMSLRP